MGVQIQEILRAQGLPMVGETFLVVKGPFTLQPIQRVDRVLSGNQLTTPIVAPVSLGASTTDQSQTKGLEDIQLSSIAHPDSMVDTCKRPRGIAT